MSTYLDSGVPSVGGKAVLIHEFKIGDSDEPDLIANMVIAGWLEQNRIGQWIYENNIPLTTRIVSNTNRWYPTVEVFANLTEKQLTEYYLIK